MPKTVYSLALPLTPLSRQSQQLARVVASLAPTHHRLKPQAYLVGGAVRDVILNILPKDIDIEIYHIELPQLDALLRQTYGNSAVQANTDYGTWEIHTKAGNLNVSIPRVERHTGPGHTDIKIELNPHLARAQALLRRDFTINAMLADALTGQVYDPYQGTRDIQNGLLRPVQVTTFSKDALRAWRAIQLLGRYNLRPSPTLRRLLRQMTRTRAMHVLSGERILAECDKLFSRGTKPSRALELAGSTGLLDTRIQPIAKLRKNKLVWRALLAELDRCTTELNGTQTACWQTILKALSPKDGSALIDILKLPKKYRLPKATYTK